jgi:hypothetical protein
MKLSQPFVRGALLACMLASVTLAAVAQNTHYRWLDDRGNPVHSDRPPEDGQNYEVVTTGSSLMREVEGSKGAVPPETAPRVGNEFEQTDKEPAQIKKNPEYCDRAQKNLETLDNFRRIRVRDENGEFRYLSEEEVEEQRREAKAAISVHCD